MEPGTRTFQQSPIDCGCRRGTEGRASLSGRRELWLSREANRDGPVSAHAREEGDGGGGERRQTGHPLSRVLHHLWTTWPLSRAQTFSGSPQSPRQPRTGSDLGSCGALSHRSPWKSRLSPVLSEIPRWKSHRKPLLWPLPWLPAARSLFLLVDLDMGDGSLAPFKFAISLPLLGIPQLGFGSPSLVPRVILDGCEEPVGRQ